MTTAEITTDQVQEREESQFFVIKTIKKAIDTVSDKVKNYNDYIKKAVETGKNFGEGLRKDSQLVIERAKEKGKKIMPAGSVKEKVEKNVSGGFKSIANYMNLPTKADIEKLNTAIETLNTRVDKLSEKQSA